jgi:hypothetical protein
VPSTPEQPATGPEQEPVQEPVQDPVQEPVPTPDPVSEPGETPVPSEAELRRLAEPARVRRAPKFSVFIAAGAIVGAVVALLLALLIGGGDDEAGRASSVPTGTGFISFLDGQGAVNTVLGLTGAVVGGFAGGGLAVLADRRSRDPLA